MPTPLPGRQLEPKREFWPRGIDINPGSPGYRIRLIEVPWKIIFGQRAGAASAAVHKKMLFSTKSISQQYDEYQITNLLFAH